MKITVTLEINGVVLSSYVEAEGNSVPNFASATQAAMDHVGGTAVALQWLTVPPPSTTAREVLEPTEIIVPDEVPNNHIDVVDPRAEGV